MRSIITRTSPSLCKFHIQPLTRSHFVSTKLKLAEEKIEEYRLEIDHRKAENYGFASMAAVPYAHTVAHMLRNKKPMGTVVTLAPNPKDIVSWFCYCFFLLMRWRMTMYFSPLSFKIWENINKSDATLARKRTMGWVYLFLVCSINTVPLLVVSFLANLASVRPPPHPSPPTPNQH